MRRDIASAYVLTASRIVGWLIISALVYRRLGKDAFALLVLVRSTVGLLGNTSLGLAPAMISRLARKTELNAIYSNGIALAFATASVAVVASLLYGAFFTVLHRAPLGFGYRELFVLASAMGVGVTLRMIGDAPAAVLQTSDRIALDNLLMAAAELLWVTLSAIAVLMQQSLAWVGVALLTSNLALLLARMLVAHGIVGSPHLRFVKRGMVTSLLSFGVMVAIAELADFLYAPTDYILINRLLGPSEVGTYAPAVMIDGALLLLVVAVAEVLLPKTALAHHAGDRELVRRYYVVGTLATAVILVVAGIGAYLVSPAIFRLWLGKKLYDTRAILPLVLIHTVIGGSSVVGRSILLGMGKVKPFTTAVIIAGVSNVILSYCFVRYLDLGLRGIIFGTIVAVVGRCALWMPWYVMRALRTIPT